MSQRKRKDEPAEVPPHALDAALAKFKLYFAHLPELSIELIRQGLPDIKKRKGTMSFAGFWEGW